MKTNILIGTSVDIIVSDINPNMLEVGKKRAIEKGIFDELQFMVANAEMLTEIQNDSLDLYTIAFGIRNVTDRPKALKEAYRGLRKGGRFMCLEFSEVVVPGFKQIEDAGFKCVSYTNLTGGIVAIHSGFKL